MKCKILLLTINSLPPQYGGTNFTAFRLIDTNKPALRKVVSEIVLKEMQQGRAFDFQDGNMDTTTALIYDAVELFARALHKYNSYQDVSVPTQLNCEGESSWIHKESLVNDMKRIEFEGLSGFVKFDALGARTDFSLDIMELHMTGMEPIGQWRLIDGLVMTRESKVSNNIVNSANVMANKTFVVTLVENPPYTMLKEEKKKLEGNNRFEGFAVDLMSAIASVLNFNVTYKLVDDGKWGSKDEHGNWNGMIREVIVGPEEGGADFAIADLSVTSQRAEAVQFSMPWMDLGISIIYIKPRAAPPSLLSFASPFTLEVWMYTAFGKNLFIIKVIKADRIQRSLYPTGYAFVSIMMWVLARFSPYEWDNPYPCIEEPEELENQFSLSNSFWFTIGSLMQQGSDVAPISISTRLVAGVWFFFAMIVIASYTANLAAFLTVVTLEKPIESADDLANQIKIKYGTLEGGSTMNFFKTSENPVFQTMWEFMSGPLRPEVMMPSNTEGIKHVVEENGGYAYLMESSSIEYIVERNCKVTQIGGTLDNKGYGIAIAPNTPYKPFIDSAILKVKEDGMLHKLKTKWWKQKRGGGACAAAEGGGSVDPLGFENVAGVFMVTLGGCLAAALMAVVEFMYGAKQLSEEMGTTWVHEMKEEFKFAMRCYGSSKTVRKPHEDTASTSSGEGIGGGGDASLASQKSKDGSVASLESASQGPSPIPSNVSRNRKSRFTSGRRSSVSSAENTYARSNGSNNPYGYFFNISFEAGILRETTAIQNDIHQDPFLIIAGVPDEWEPRVRNLLFTVGPETLLIPTKTKFPRISTTMLYYYLSLPVSDRRPQILPFLHEIHALTIPWSTKNIMVTSTLRLDRVHSKSSHAI